MNHTSNRNPYETLKLDVVVDHEPIPAQSTWTITEDKTETISILTAILPGGYWCFGYSVFWSSGRHSHMNPNPAMGVFSAQREAQLYALGFMSLHTSSFIEPTKIAILKAVAEKSQDSLF